MASDSDNRRHFFRLRFPTKEQVRIRIGRGRFRVAELSVGGMRICATQVPNRAGVFQGQLELTERTIPVIGIVSRLEEDELVIIGLHGLTEGDILREQQRVLRKFPVTRS